MKLYTLIFTLLIFFNVFGQKTSVTGKITDETTGEELIGVNIVTQENIGSTTDISGDFTLDLEQGKHTLTISYVGYKTQKKEINITSDQPIILNILLKQAAIDFGDEIVISGSRYEKRASEEVISIEVIKPDLIVKTNANRLDEVLRRVSGVNVADGQANIRGGSGWSYSVGSRVGMVIDGQNILTPDRGSIKWKFMPIEIIGQVEVMKGASSILYGSAAMNGTIHIQTIKPTKTPENRIVSYVGISDRPANKAAKWWSKPRMSGGSYFTRAHKVNDNFEYVVGGNVNYTQLPYQDNREYQIRTSFNLKWTSKKDKQLSYGVRGNIMRFKETDFIFWQNADSGAYKPFTDIEFSYRNYTIDPYLIKYDKKGNRHEFRSRLYYYNTSFSLQSINLMGEYIFSKTWENNWTIVSGINNQFLFVKDNAIGDGRENANFSAVYMQADKVFDKISITGGLRAEFFKIGDKLGVTYAFSKADESSDVIKYIPFPMMRFGFNYRPNNSNFIRFNIGQAFRLPSLAEAFVQYDLEDLITISSNPDLKPEYGWTSEIGYKHIFRQRKIQSSIDVALFFQKYNDLIEFDVRVIDPVIPKFGLVATNISEARILGYEANWKTKVELKNDHVLNFDFGYTYTLPVDLSLDEMGKVTSVKNYIKEFFRGMAPIDKMNKDVQSTLLRYRNRHLVNFIGEYENKHIFVGLYLRYYSMIENFDPALGFFIDGAGEYYLKKLEASNGDVVIDANLGYKINSKHSLSLNVTNITNREYSLRLARLDPPRAYTLQYKYTF